MSKSRENSRVGGRSSGIALLVASTILLAAAGETMWHANANASASEGRWAGPRVGVAAAMMAADAAAIAEANDAAVAEEEINSMTLPDFKPFVFVPLTLPGDPGDWTVVEGSGVFMNESGDLVATLEDDSNNKRLFVWWDEGHSNGSTTTGGWKGPVKDSSNNPILLYHDGAVGGAAGINAADKICGTRSSSGNPVAFVFTFTDLAALKGSVADLANGYAADINGAAVVVGTSSGSPQAWSQMFSGPIELPALNDNAGTAAWGVEPDGGLTPFVAGQSEDGQPVVQAVVWYKATDWEVVDLSELDTQDEAVGIATAVSEGGHVVGAVLNDTTYAVEETVLWYYHAASWTGYAIDTTHDDFLPRAISPVYCEVVGSHYLWVPTSLGSGEGELLDLLEVTIGLPPMEDILSFTAWDINDAGEICGVIELDDETVPRLPFKIVPYDTDNNGVPDYREIVADAQNLDTDGNWLLDKSEDMRVGLYAAGVNPADTRADEIDDIQAVRLHLDSDLVQLIANNGTACQNTETALINWRNSEDQKEIIALIRTRYPANDRFDYVLTGQDREDYLDALFCFAYRYAYDIDFIQFGNEVFGGPGEYVVETSCEEGYERISDVDETCYAQACQQVIDWMEVQIEVARMASALAGRPLRFVTPAFSIGHVITGKDGDLREPPEFDVAATRAAFAVQCIIGLGNAQQAWVDLHLHYDEDGQLEDALYYFTTPNQYTWDVPAWRTSLEWSPKPTETWVNNAMPEYRKYFDALETPTMLWDDFVYDWGENNLRVNFPDFANDLTEIESYGLLHACYGEFQQGIVPKEGNPLRPVPDEFDLTVVRANAVRPHEDWIADYTNLFTTIRGDLEEDNTAYLIPSFTPHPNAPTSSCACVPRP